MSKRMKKKDWAEFAACCAHDAHTNWFASRRGSWYFEDLDVVVLYNNNPYAGHPTLRDEELAEFRERLIDPDQVEASVVRRRQNVRGTRNTFLC